MENEYYTPVTEEFRVGFEYECRLKLRHYTTEPESNKIISYEDIWEDWFKCTFDGDPEIGAAGDHSESYPLLEYHYYKGREFRVKYLDHTDIIECGWVGGYQIANRVVYHNKERALISHTDSRRVIITREIGGLEILNEEKPLGSVFDGYINNKSELKVLMRQLKIT